MDSADNSTTETSDEERQRRVIAELASERQRLTIDLESEIVIAAQKFPSLSYADIGIAAGYPERVAYRTVSAIVRRAGVPPRKGGPKRRNVQEET